MPIILFGMYFMKRYNPEEYNQLEEEDQINNENDESYLRNLVRYMLIILIALSYCATNMSYIIYLLYASTYYQFLSIGITASKAANIMSVMSLFFTIGRIMAIFEIKRMSAELMIAIHLTITFSSQLLLFFGQNIKNLMIIWIANVFIGNRVL